MKDYKAIFDGVESTLFKIGSRRLRLEQIRAELEPSKHVDDGLRFDRLKKILLGPSSHS